MQLNRRGFIFCSMAAMKTCAAILAAADARVEFFDVFGKPTGVTSVAKGVSRLDIPASGFAKIAW